MARYLREIKLSAYEQFFGVSRSRPHVIINIPYNYKWDITTMSSTLIIIRKIIHRISSVSDIYKNVSINLHVLEACSLQ